MIENELFNKIVCTNDAFCNMIFNYEFIDKVLFSNINTDKLFTDIENKKITNCIFTNCTFKDIKFVNNIIMDCIFDHCVFNNCEFTGEVTFIHDTDFVYCDLKYSNFKHCSNFSSSSCKFDGCTDLSTTFPNSYRDIVFYNKGKFDIDSGYILSNNIIVQIDIPKEAKILYVYGKFDYFRTNICIIKDIYIHNFTPVPIYVSETNKVSYEYPNFKLDSIMLELDNTCKQYKIGDKIIIQDFDEDCKNVYHSRNKNIGIGFFHKESSCLDELNRKRGN